MDRVRRVHRMEAAVARRPPVLIRPALIRPVRMTDPRIGRQEPRRPGAKNPEVVARDRIPTAMNHPPAPTDLAPRKIAHPKGEDATIDRVRPADGHLGIRHRPNHRGTEIKKCGRCWYHFLPVVLDQSPIAATMKESTSYTARQGLSQG